MSIVVLLSCAGDLDLSESMGAVFFYVCRVRMAVRRLVSGWMVLVLTFSALSVTDLHNTTNQPTNLPPPPAPPPTSNPTYSIYSPSQHKKCITQPQYLNL